MIVAENYNPKTNTFTMTLPFSTARPSQITHGLIVVMLRDALRAIPHGWTVRDARVMEDGEALALVERRT